MKMGEVAESIIPLRIANAGDREIERLVRRRVGEMTFLHDSRELDGDTIYDFGFYVERRLFDASENYFKVKFVPFAPIYQVKKQKHNSDYRLVVPDRSLIGEKLDNRVSSFRTGSESALLKAIGDRMLGIWQIRNQINPLFEILTNVVDGPVTVDDFVSGRRTEDKARKYLKFLSGFDIIKEEDGGFVIGRILESKLDSDNDESHVYNEVLSLAIQKGHTYMSEFLNFTHIQPWIRLSNSNYLPSFHAKKRLSMTDEDLRSYQKTLYGPNSVTKVQVKSRATQMVNIGVFKKNKSVDGSVVFEGSEEVYAEYSDTLEPRAAQYGIT